MVRYVQSRWFWLRGTGFMMYSFLFRNEAKANGYYRCIGLEILESMNEEVVTDCLPCK
jgi:hypothetical protein